MIRLGRYDAFDKWEILCRYWQDRASVADIGADKFGRPRLAEWHKLAALHGTTACIGYLRAKDHGVAEAEIDRGDILYREISRLRQQSGFHWLQTRVLRLIDTMTEAGFLAPFGDGLSPRLVDRMREVFKMGALQGLHWTNELGEIPTTEILRLQKSTAFPHNSVKFRRNVLAIFCAWFYGRSDIIHIYDASPDHVTLVDLNISSLEDMKLIYPAHWTYVHADYRHFIAEEDAKFRSYDLIICDPFKDLAEAVAWDTLPAIMRLCTDTFITNYSIDMFAAMGVEPDDIEGLSRAVKQRTGVDAKFTQTVPRGNGIYWAVIRRN